MKKVMRSKKVIAIMGMGLVAILLVAGGIIASAPPGAGDPPVESKINYQGQLTDDAGNPLNGTYDMEFQFYDSATGGSQVGGTITKNDVQVDNGLFNVKLDVNQADFNGQGLWLGVIVEGETLSPRQEILPVPYALSLKPGATVHNTAGVGIRGQSDNDDGVVGTTGASDKSGVFGNSQVGTGVTGRSEAVSGYGVAGTATAGNGRGVYGNALGENGVGVYGRSDLGRGVEGHTTSDSEWVPAIYGKNVGAGDGVYGWSQNRHGIFGVTSSQNPDHAGVYGTNNGAGPAVKAEGDLVVTGAYRGDIGPNGGAPFPRPAYDSGWVDINPGQWITFTHNLGGNPDNYVVELLQQEIPGYAWGINNRGIGTDTWDGIGACWGRLTNAQIEVYRASDDYAADKVRIRIWVYE
jgi:hypothetical protein